MKEIRRTTKRLICSFFMVVLATLFTSICHAENLVDNPGFEQVAEDGFPMHWKKWGEANGSEVRPDHTTAHSGKSSLLIVQTKPLALPKEASEAPNLVRYIFGEKLGGDSVLYKEVPVEAEKKYNFSFWFKASGLLRENRDNLKSGYAAFQVWVHWMDDKHQAVGGRDARLWVLNQQVNASDWIKLSNSHANGGGSLFQPYIAPHGARFAKIEFKLITAAPDVTPKVWIDDVSLIDADSEECVFESKLTRINIPNAGFEEVTNGEPKGWKSIGSSENALVDNTPHSGKRSVSVANAGQGQFSGWYREFPAKFGSSYTASTWAKGGDLASYGGVNGGALCLQFLDAEGQLIGNNIISKPVTANSDWTRIQIEKYPAPQRTEKLRLIVGLEFCKGTAWFDDLSLTEERNEALSGAMLRRPNPQPDPEISYTKNLLFNGTIEKGENGKPKGWTYVGSSKKDWTDAEIKELHGQGRPSFTIGRGRGEWSHKLSYAGKGALLNISIDPPLSPNMNWYGRSPVDGYWLSDSMPCKANREYLAGAWFRPGVKITEPWYGPLEIRFYDANGRFIKAANDPVRGGSRFNPGGAWTYWPTMPYIAPAGAKTMRLRFGQELHTAIGGWGRTYGDNFAVWEVQNPISAKTINEMVYHLPTFWKWFRESHATRKPPYLPSPVEAPEYESARGSVQNSSLGNIFYTPAAPIQMKFTVNSFIGEKRAISVTFNRFDHLGNEDATIEVPAFKVHGYSSTTIEFTVPPTKKYGTFYLEGKIMEGEAVVGSSIGRYAVLPKLDRPRTAENIWSVCLSKPELIGDGGAYEKELGKVLHTAGFGRAWVQVDLEIDKEQRMNEALKQKRFYADYGMQSILTFRRLKYMRPVDAAYYTQLGKTIGKKFKGKVLAYGNWGVEQANHRTPVASVFRPFIDGQMLSDKEYDQILAAMYNGLKASDPATPVLIGNIATDWEGATVRRLYGKPAEGRFDGAILNAYMAILRTSKANLAEFDKHGDTQKTVWQDECGHQRSPDKGPARRYGEVEGAYNMVRTWLMMKCKVGPRLKAMTMWAFEGFHKDNGVAMVTADLQPRPQFSAHAVMADATADANFVADRSMPNVTIFEWKRSDGPMFTLWADAGEKSVTFDAPEGKLTVMDCMGNRSVHTATDGVVSLNLSGAPIYVFGGGALKISSKLETTMGHGSLKSKNLQISLTLKNNSNAAISGNATFSGPVEGKKEQTFNIEAGGISTLQVPVAQNLPTDKRTSFSAELTTDNGAVYMASSGMNFAQAVKTVRAPSLDGTWIDWKKAKVIKFGITESQIGRPGLSNSEASYNGKEDIQGSFRMLWDDKFLYLGVEALDDSFQPQPLRGLTGYTGDSIELAVQPDNNLSSMAKYWEYEFYLPDGKAPYAASRRSPAPSAMIDNWKATVKPTGERGNCNYQLAIPWSDLGIEKPITGQTISFALVLNDADKGERIGGGRCRIRWFDGIDMAKSPEGFGDVTLVE